MANEIKTRIALKEDTLANWQSSVFNGTDNTKYLKKGEVAITTITTTKKDDKGNIINIPCTLIKIGDGVNKYDNLPWVSALAADVYTWAKEQGLTINKDGTGNVVSGIEWDATANGGKGGIKFTTADVATAEGFNQLQNDVAALEQDITNNRDAWAKDDNTTYTFTQSDDGKSITITPSEGQGKTITFAFLTQAEIEALNYLVAADITTGSINGTIAVDGTNVAVKGLQDAAYTTVASLNSTAKGYADAVQNSLGDLATKDNITASLVTDFATEVAKVKVANATHADAAGKVDNALTVTVGGTNVVFDGSVAKTADVDAAISAAVEAKHVPEYSIAKDATSEYAATYHLTKDGVNIGTAINIPKDMVVESGRVETLEAGVWGEAGTYIILTLSNATNDKLYINVGDLIEYVTSGSTPNDAIVIDIDANHQVTATISDGKITKAKLETSVQTSLGKADTALQASDITGKADKVTGAISGNFAGLDSNGNLVDSGKNANSFDAKGTAQGLIDGLGLGTMATENAADYTKTADLGNLATKDKISATDFANEVFIFDCGSATEVI